MVVVALLAEGADLAHQSVGDPRLAWFLLCVYPMVAGQIGSPTRSVARRNGRTSRVPTRKDLVLPRMPTGMRGAPVSAAEVGCAAVPDQLPVSRAGALGEDGQDRPASRTCRA